MDPSSEQDMMAEIMYAVPRARSSDTTSSASLPVADAMDVSGRASPASTPPTSLSGAPSDVIDAPKEEPKTEQRRSTRTRSSIGTYNLQVLAGTNIHTPTKYLRKNAGQRVSLEETAADEPLESSEVALDSALNNDWTSEPPHSDALEKETEDSSDKPARRKSTRLGLVKEASSNAVAAAASATNVVLESGRDAIQSWAGDRNQRSRSGKSQSSARMVGSTSKRARDSLEDDHDLIDTMPEFKKKAAPAKRKYQYIDQGLYVGQAAPKDTYLGEKKSKSKHTPTIETPSNRKGADWFPLPMFHGEKTIAAGRDFKLPRDILDPLPRAEKPANWHVLRKNRLIGDAADLYHDQCRAETEESRCKCPDYCDETCLNVSMNYECDSTNCALGSKACGNRQFADLDRRVKRNNMYDVGVEVLKTKDRGYGVRAMRAFKPGQIIMEYTGEVIDQWECERRMREEYKDNDCYYLMSFIPNLIIDATKGSMARFVNHSCEPNCSMRESRVSGKPRMALFAKDKPIQAGEELTYDYNFAAFKQGWSQECRCGSAQCRGVLGPRPKKEKEPKAGDAAKGTLKSAAKSAVNALKRKAQEVVQDLTSAKRPKLMKAARSVLGASEPAIAESPSPSKALQSETREERAARRADPRKALSRASKDPAKTAPTRKLVVQKKTTVMKVHGRGAITAKKNLPLVSKKTTVLKSGRGTITARKAPPPGSKKPLPPVSKGSSGIKAARIMAPRVFWQEKAAKKAPSKKSANPSTAALNDDDIDADMRAIYQATLDLEMEMDFDADLSQYQVDWEDTLMDSDNGDEVEDQIREEIATSPTGKKAVAAATKFGPEEKGKAVASPRRKASAMKHN